MIWLILKVLHRHTLAMSDKWKVLLLLFGVNFLLRLSTLFQQVVNIDEPQYAQLAWEWMNGNPPYTTSFGDKPFFCYLFYYVILSLFGKFNLIPVHLATIIVVTFTAFALTLTGKRVLGPQQGLAAGLLFSCLTTMGDFRLIASDGESLMNLPMCFGMFVFLIALEKRRWFYFLLTGLLIGLASQFRYQGGIQLAVVGSYFLLFDRKLILSALPTITLSLLFCFGLVFAWLWWLGSWEAYSFWSWEYQADYIRAGLQTINPWKKGLIRTSLTILGGFVVWWAAAETVFRCQRDKSFLADPKVKRLFLVSLLWLLFGYAAVTTGGRFAPRYFTQIFPPLALLAAMTFNFQSAWRRWLLLVPLFGFWVTRFFAPSIYAAAGVFDYTPFQKEIGEYIRERTRPEDRIYIWGWGNGMYVYAERQPATRFMNTDFVTGRIPGSPTAYDLNFDTSFNIIPGSWDMLMEDLEHFRPVYILDTAPANIHDYIKYPISKYPRLQDYLNQNYTLEATLFDVHLYRRKAKEASH